LREASLDDEGEAPKALSVYSQLVYVCHSLPRLSGD